MTDKEFRRLSRADLIEIIYELQKSEKKLQQENESLKQQLKDRRVEVSGVGSLAEALAKAEEECRQIEAAARKEVSASQRGSKDLELDAILRAVREGRYADESEG